MRTRSFALIMLLLAVAPMAWAQTSDSAASAEEESFHTEPRAVPAGAEDFELKLVAHTDDLFAYNGPQPEVQIGSGATLIDGSVSFDSSSEISLKVNVDAGRVGVVAVFVDFFAVDDSNVIIKRARGHIGVAGPLELNSGSGAAIPLELSVSQIEHIQIGVEEPQRAGDIFIKGAIAGDIALETPFNMRFAPGQDPVATVEDGRGSIANPGMGSARQIWGFDVANSGGSEVTLRISNIWLDTSTYDEEPSVSREYTMLVDGALFIDAPLLVVAYSAGGTQEGDEIDQDLEAPDEAETDDTSGTGQTSPVPAGSGGGNRTGRSDASSGSSGNNRNNRANNNRRRWSRSSGGQRASAARGGYYRPNSTRSGGGSVSSGGGGGSFGPSSGGSRGGASNGDSSGTGTIEADSVESAEPRDAETNDSADGGSIEERGEARRANPFPKLRQASGLFFANNDWQPVSGLVLQRLERGEWRGRVWIVFEGASESAEVETVSVRVKVDGRERQVTLTETSAESGVFHSDENGIDLATQADND